MFIFYGLCPLKLASILFIPLTVSCYIRPLLRLQERYKPKLSQDDGCRPGSKQVAWLGEK